MQEMVIYGVSFDLVGKQPIVLLKTADGNKFLPIWIGHSEAAAILMKLQNSSSPRPLTHDLFTDVLGQLDARVTRVAVTELRENTFYAQITVQQNGSELEIDSRPSDAIALAIRVDAPIFVADDVIEESGIEFEGEEVNEEEMVDEFKRFLDRVSPDEFASGPGRLAELALRQREDVLDEVAEAGFRERPAVRLLERPQQLALAVRVEERDPVRLLVGLQLGDEVDPRVDGRDERPVGGRDPRPERLDRRRRARSPVDGHRLAVGELAEEPRGDPHRDAHAAVRGRERGHRRVPVDGEAAQEVHRVPEHPVPPDVLAVDPERADRRVAGRAGRDVDDRGHAAVFTARRYWLPLLTSMCVPRRRAASASGP